MAHLPVILASFECHPDPSRRRLGIVLAHLGSSGFILANLGVTLTPPRLTMPSPWRSESSWRSHFRTSFGPPKIQVLAIRKTSFCWHIFYTLFARIIFLNCPYEILFCRASCHEEFTQRRTRIIDLQSVLSFARVVFLESIL